ncbi:MAG: hypothetical protein ACI9QC_000720 [Oceanicoccus sp.]|jgi:hypothetical protein
MKISTYLALAFVAMLSLSACTTNETLSNDGRENTENEFISAESVEEEVETPAADLVLDADDELCTADVTTREEIGGLQYPTHELYSDHKDSVLAALFTAMACGEDRVDWLAGEVFPNGTTESGIYATSTGFSDELLATFEELGFVLYKEGENSEGEAYETYALQSKVPYEDIMVLKGHADQNWSSVWGGVSE